MNQNDEREVTGIKEIIEKRLLKVGTAYKPNMDNRGI
jgi:hypothetical protein